MQFGVEDTFGKYCTGERWSRRQPPSKVLDLKKSLISFMFDHSFRYHVMSLGREWEQLKGQNLSRLLNWSIEHTNLPWVWMDNG